MEASYASNSTPQAGTGAEDTAVGSQYWNLAAAKVLKEDGALAVLVKSLSQEGDLALQKHAAETLRNLSAVEDRDTKLQILNEEGTLEGLVKCLCKNKILVGLRKITAETLGNLAAAHENCIKIVGIGGALEGLAESLFVHGNADLQEQGARALSMLARQSDARIVIANEKRALLGIVKALSEHNKPGLQRHAMLAWELLWEKQSITQKNQNRDAAIGGILKCLSAIDNPGLQEPALKVLRSLLYHEENFASIYKNLEEENGAIAGIVNCLSASNNDEMRGRAAEVLDVMAEIPEWKIRIADEDGVIGSLVKCISAIHSPDLQKRAIWVLNNLAAGPCTATQALTNRIDNVSNEGDSDETDAIACLVKILSPKYCCHWQIHVLQALANLAESGDAAVKQRIVDEDGAICGLVKCLSSPSADCAELRREAAKALASITGKTRRL